jgi:UDP-N-acetylglucosamine 4-epimerase
MTRYAEALEGLQRSPQAWLVTGVAGFIGSHLAETLLKHGQKVTGLDNFATGRRDNLEALREAVGEEAWKRFTFLESDIRDLEACREACAGVDRVLHQAALGSVVRSVEKPLDSHEANVTGFLHMLLAARDAGVKRLVYASSSAAYGDDPQLPKVEDRMGRCLSPYGLTKLVDELYADIFARCYGFEAVGLRYFNVFGPRQDPHSAYAAVIPAFIEGLLEGKPVYINGDGLTSRDFCYVDNVVQANLLAALTDDANAVNTAYNVAVGGQTSLNALYAHIQAALSPRFPHARSAKPIHRDFRKGDMKFSQADISKARNRLGYEPAFDVKAGLERTIDWFVAQRRRRDESQPRQAVA